jgi:hypothetical protein
MTQLSIAQYGYLVEALDPMLHFLLVGGILLVLLEGAVLLGDLLGTGERHRSDD